MLGLMRMHSEDASSISDIDSSERCYGHLPTLDSLMALRAWAPGERQSALAGFVSQLGSVDHRPPRPSQQRFPLIAPAQISGESLGEEGGTARSTHSCLRD